MCEGWNKKLRLWIEDGEGNYDFQKQKFGFQSSQNQVKIKGCQVGVRKSHEKRIISNVVFWTIQVLVVANGYCLLLKPIPSPRTTASTAPR